MVIASAGLLLAASIARAGKNSIPNVHTLRRVTRSDPDPRMEQLLWFVRDEATPL